MTFQKKLLSLAVIGLALSAPVAHAAIDNGVNSPGNGELFFSLWSDNGTATTADDVSYTRDLGIKINDFASAVNPITLAAAKITAGYTQSFAADTLLSSFLNSATLAGANLLWNVVGADSFGADRFVSTAAQGTPALPAQSTSLHRQVGAAGVPQYVSAVNGLAGNTNLALNNSITATFSDGNAYAGGTAWGSSLGGRVSFNSAGTIGAQLPFFLQYETSTTQTGNALQQQFTSALGAGANGSAAYWTLDASGNLSYNVAAVPEADTWAMFAAGLLAVGAIARRRLAA